MGLLCSVSHPHHDRLTHTLLESCSKSAIAPETALLSQLLSGEGTISGDSLTIESDKVLDAQAVDIGIVGSVMLREVLAEVSAIGADGPAEIVEFEVVLQIELCGLAILFQQLADVGGDVG